MSTTRPLQAALRAYAHRILARLAFRDSPCAASDTVSDNRWTVKLIVEPAQPNATDPYAWLSEVERRAFDAATHQPIPVKALARKARYKPTNYFGDAIRSLIRRGLLRRTPEGICLP